LKLPKFLDDHYCSFLLTVTVLVLSLWAYVDYVDATGYCGKTCQALKKTEGKAEPCYGIYCKDKPKDENQTKAKQSKEVEKAQPCYGIYCDDKPTDNQTKVIKPGTKEDFIYQLGQKNFISLRVSNACKHIDTCPNVKELADMYDNSNKYLSGDFYFDNKSDAWKRTSPKIPNVFELYKFIDMPWFLWVDPDDYTWDRSKQIIIEPSLRYIKRSDIIDENRIRYEYEGLSLKRCASAVIGWENNGSEILLDVLNHFYSNCREQVKYDPTIEIFMGTKVFEDCDQRCLYLKDRFKMELKADALAYGDGTTVKPEPVKSSDKPCYGIYCKKDKPTTEETVTDLKDKEKIRQERLKELEDIQKCEKLKRKDAAEGRVDRNKFDCKVAEERKKYLEGRE